MKIPEQRSTDSHPVAMSAEKEPIGYKVAGLALRGIAKAMYAYSDMKDKYELHKSSRNQNEIKEYLKEVETAKQIGLECELFFMRNKESVTLVDSEAAPHGSGGEDFTHHRGIGKTADDRLVTIDRYVGEKSFHNQDKLPVMYNNGEKHYVVRVFDPVEFGPYGFTRNGVEVSVSPERPSVNLAKRPFVRTDDRLERFLEQNPTSGYLGGCGSESVRPVMEDSTSFESVQELISNLAAYKPQAA